MPTTRRIALCTTTYPRETVTIYGCVSNATIEPIMWYFARTTNAKDFLTFCKQIRKKLLPQYKDVPVTLVIDNHSGHICRWTTQRLKWKTVRMERLLTPTNSSFLNPSEQIWSNLKRIYRYRLASLRLTRRNLTRKDLLTLGEESMQSISEQTGRNLYHGATGDIIQFLQQRVDEYDA